MRKILGFIGSLLIATAALASSSEAYRAKCPENLIKLENQFWDQAMDVAEAKAMDRGINYSCYVYNPAFSSEDFQKMVMISRLFTQYPDVIRPWEINDNGSLTIIRGNYSGSSFEFIKILYQPSNGNLFLSTITLTPKVD